MNKRKESEFEHELYRLINRFSQENMSNTPDFILARYLVDSLEAFNNSVNAREAWYGRTHTLKKYYGPCDGSCAGDELGDCSHAR